jgi:hypothetical protein
MRRCAPLLLLAGALLAAPAPAGANGDPASDVLLSADLFVPAANPQEPPIHSRRPGQSTAPANPNSGEASAASRQLQEVIDQAKQERFPIKVAVIPTRADLGLVPGLFGRPQQYADFLYTELLGYRGNLLVVMPQGFGVAGPSARGAKADLGDRRVTARDTAGLTRDAAAGVRAFAESAGKPLGGGSSGLVIAIIAVLAGLAVALAVVLRLRAGNQEAPPPGGDPTPAA